MYRKIFFLFLVLFTSQIFGHDGHEIAESLTPPENWAQWINWLGNYHLVLLHFPIALITMATFAEILSFFSPKVLFKDSARFMLITGGIIAVPTALLGLALSYNFSYVEMAYNFFWWHRLIGLCIAGFSLLVIFFKEKYPNSFIYYASLGILFITINITSYLGGRLSFEFFRLFPSP